MTKLRHKLKPVEDDDPEQGFDYQMMGAGRDFDETELKPQPSVNKEFVVEQQKTLAKVMINEQTPRCPYCNSTKLEAVGVRSGATAFANARCTSCRRHFRI